LLASGKNWIMADDICSRVGLGPPRTMIMLDSGLIRFVLRPMAR
jgi:hypothetical protein